MTVKLCDRCNEIIPQTSDMSQAHFPKVEVQVTRGIGLYSSVDLCNLCAKDFVNWLRNGEVKNDDKD